MQDLKSHPAIISIFSSRLKDLEKRGDSFWAKCIFHPDHNPSLNVGRDEKQQWVFNCFGCGKGGDVIEFIKAADNISFKEAVKILETTVGGSWSEAKKLAETTFKKLELGEIKPNKRYSLDEYVRFEIALYESSEAKDWLFKERGITYNTAKKLHFGYANSISELNKKHSPELDSIADRGWIVTPAVEGNEIVCIEARSMVEKQFVRKSGMENKVLWGVDFIDWSQPLYLVEGKFDQAIMIQAGFCAVSLPSASTNLTPEMRDKLMSASVLILAGDNDGGVGTNKMLKLWSDLQERTYRLIWPKGMKDANQTFLETSSRDIIHFKNLVENLTMQAYSNPMPGVKSIQDILQNDESGTSEDHPDRFRFSSKAIDRMANILPGSVVYVSATQTGSGKTQWTLQETLNAARKHDEVVINYQTEMQDNEIGEIVTANLLARERNNIKKEDRLEAAKRLKGCLYYIGNNPNLNTMTEVLDLIEAGIRRVGATTCVIDHLHFICRNEKDEYKAQAQAMQRIKRMAQKHMLKFFVVGQPRKPGQKTQGKAIDIYDSKGSESIISDSDVVYYMHRDVIKNMTEETMDNLSPEVQIRCMKGRSRGKGSALVKLFFLGKIATFREIEPIQEPIINKEFEF